MEQYSKLAATAARFYRSFPSATIQARRRGFAAASTGRIADHDVYSGKPEETREHYEQETAKRETGTENMQPSKGTEPLAPPRLPHGSSPRLENVGVKNPVKPQVQQRMEKSAAILREVPCAGLDGTPYPEEQEKQQLDEDDNEYYKHHKASPLSEIKVADTRKPITRATDGTGDAGGDYGRGRNVIGWMPEQLDSAEESMARARRIWLENAVRGDPDSPHGRVLRRLRGEWF